jgi:hypothetical protein
MQEYRDEKLNLTSPEYILEKYNGLIGVEPYDYFIQEPKLLSKNFNNGSLGPKINYKDWDPVFFKTKNKEYYKFLNILNLIENFDYLCHPEFNLKIFKKYIGDIENINTDNSYKSGIHPNLREYTEEYLNRYQRYVKLLTL